MVYFHTTKSKQDGCHHTPRVHTHLGRTPPPGGRFSRRSHNPHLAWLVLARHAARGFTGGSSERFPSPGRVVHEGYPHVCRRLGPGALGPEASCPFFPVPLRLRTHTNSSSTLRMPHRHPLLRPRNGQSPARV